MGRVTYFRLGILRALFCSTHVDSVLACSVANMLSVMPATLSAGPMWALVHHESLLDRGWATSAHKSMQELGSGEVSGDVGGGVPGPGKGRRKL